MLWLLIDITLFFTLNSCVPVPVPVGAFTRKPYSPEKLQVLLQKDADKGLVKEVLGYPQAERLSGRYWFYASNRETVGFIGGGDLIFDGSPEGVINYKTYLFLKHPPGDVFLEAYQFDIKKQCRKGERIYLKAVESWKSYETGKDLKLVDEGEGESAIRSRKLALPY